MKSIVTDGDAERAIIGAGRKLLRACKRAGRGTMVVSSATDHVTIFQHESGNLTVECSTARDGGWTIENRCVSAPGDEAILQEAATLVHACVLAGYPVRTERQLAYLSVWRFLEEKKLDVECSIALGGGWTISSEGIVQLYSYVLNIDSVRIPRRCKNERASGGILGEAEQ